MTGTRQEIVRSGVWYYAGQTPTPVHIVRQDYDVAYELFKAEAEEGTPWPEGAPKAPRLNADGDAYYLLFGPVPPDQPWAVDQVGYMTVDEAAEAVVARFGSRCEWE
ncbi:MAG TPA: hypothetical protein VNZ64_24480 [Candidatus Acidoferrum sp.]|jgi:hypothetical protein|nr:hypothetical protein [Candidatus Acidoferrum sp.]